MNTRLGFHGVLVVVATLIASSSVVGASEAHREKAPHVDAGNPPDAPDAPEAASETRHQSGQFYGIGVTPSIYFVNFLLMYMANPNNAAYMPAYRAPIPTALSDCLQEHPSGCSYFDFALSFDDNATGKKGFNWPTECQTDAQYQQLAPRIANRPDQVNEPLGLDQANWLAGKLKMNRQMILTDEEYECTIGTSADRDDDQKTIVACLNNLGNSIGNTNIPLSSYGLAITTKDQSPDDPAPPPAGYVQSLCAPYAPCLEFNALFDGPLERLAARCGWLNKFVLLLGATDIINFGMEGAACQEVIGGTQDDPPGPCLAEPVGHSR